MGGRNWSNGDDVMIQELFEQRASDKEIAARLGRTPKAIERRRVTLGIINAARPQTIGRRRGRIKANVQRSAVVGDIRFKKAMLAAIKAGAEYAIIGVAKARATQTHMRVDR